MNRRLQKLIEEKAWETLTDYGYNDSQLLEQLTQKVLEKLDEQVVGTPKQPVRTMAKDPSTSPLGPRPNVPRPDLDHPTLPGGTVPTDNPSIRRSVKEPGVYYLWNGRKWIRYIPYPEPEKDG